MTTLNFSTDGIEPMQPFTLLQPGRYEAVIVASEQKATKKGDGTYLQLDFQVISGEAEGRHVWSRLNLDNPNETAVKIAESELTAICMAIGLTSIVDSEELHNKPILIDVAIERGKNGYDDTNRIKAYLSLLAKPAPKAAPTRQAQTYAQAKPATTLGKAPPWAKPA